MLTPRSINHLHLSHLWDEIKGMSIWPMNKEEVLLFKELLKGTKYII